MIFIVFDLETTCWDGNPPTSLREVIEIGAYKVNLFGEVLGTFQHFVKPTWYPYLSPYCQRLTSIEQEDINRASSFEKVIDRFREWIPDDSDYALCAWGKEDYKILRAESMAHELETDWLEPYIDVKKQYYELNRSKNVRGFAATLKRERIEFEGSMHRANDDALNLTKLFQCYIDQWIY